MESTLSRIERLKSAHDEARAQLATTQAELRSAYVAAHCAGERVELLDWIEAHLAATGIAATTFGVNVLGDPGFVHGLRGGREARRSTDQRVRDHLADAGKMVFKTPPETCGGIALSRPGRALRIAQ